MRQNTLTQKECPMFRVILFIVMAFLGQLSLFADDASQQQTLSIIKPDGVANKHIGDVISRFEKNGLKVAAIKMVRMTPDQASQFYAVHKDRPFYHDLVSMMSSGPIIVMVLEGNDAVAKNRQLMGATDPQKAAVGTIRADFAKSITENTVHGSDSAESAETEIAFFFKPEEIVNSSK